MTCAGCAVSAGQAVTVTHMVFDHRWPQLPFMLDAVTELTRQIKSPNPLWDVPGTHHEAEVVRATSMVADALADLQVMIGKRHVEDVDGPTAADWRSAVEHLRVAARGLRAVPSQIR